MVVTPKISVITVVRNAPDDLERTIQSVRAQTYPNVEYCVVDGASTDSTLNVIQAYSEHITQWISEPDQGIYDAMNKGARMAEGEWLIYMNAGDLFYEPKTLQKLSGHLSEKTDVLMGGVEEILTDELETRHFTRLPKPIEQIWKHLPTSHQSILVRTELHGAFPFDTRYHWCADQDCFVRMHQAGRSFQSVDTIVCRYDCAGGRARDPMLFIRERWQISRGLVPLPKRLCFFGREWLHCSVWGRCVRILKKAIPDRYLLGLRKLRRTSGI